MKRERGQAAMEFLMTYGWAILAAIIVVGVLWYIIGNPANLAGNNFQISAPFVKEAMALTATGVQVEVRNGAGDSLTVTGVDIENCGTSGAISTVIAAGDLQAFTVNCALTSGDRFNGDVTVKYKTDPASAVEQQATGAISGRVP